MHNVVDNSPTTQATSSPANQPVSFTKALHNHKRGKRLSTEHKLAIKAGYESGKSLAQLSRDNDVSYKTIAQIVRMKEFEIPSATQFQQLKKGITGMFYKRSAEALLTITQEKLDQSSALQLGTLAAIGVDKGRLMEGLSTENVSHRGVIESLEADRQRLSNQLSAVANEADAQPEQQVGEENK